jgi:hypothetical protein
MTFLEESPFARHILGTGDYDVSAYCRCGLCTRTRAGADWSGYTGGPPPRPEATPEPVEFESLPEGAFFSNYYPDGAAATDTLFVKRAGTMVRWQTAVWVWCSESDFDHAGKPCCIEPSRAVIPRDLSFEFDD